MSLIDFLLIKQKSKEQRLTDSEKYYKSKYDFYTKYLDKYTSSYYKVLHNRCQVEHQTTLNIKLPNNLSFGQDYYEVLNILGQPSFCYRYKENDQHVILAYKDLTMSSFTTTTYHFYNDELILVGFDYANLSPEEQKICLHDYINQLGMRHLKHLENPFLLKDSKKNFLLAHVNRRLKIYLGCPKVLVLND
ncbi:MAG: hypothetical protein ACPGR7_04135 [Flavobacteriaceae bacterium]